ncbi:MAG: molybdopterin cofactor-binding domain-containing protein, partial [Phycisphaerae bacterium]
HLTVGCDGEGRLTAVRARMIGDKGAYASVGAKVLERAAGHAIGPYRVPAVDIESLAVYTNNPPCGAMRGFGANQAAFAVERCLDQLAGKVGIDGWEIRWRNILEQGERFCTGQILDKPFGLKQTLLAVRDAYRNAKYAGIACGIKNVGIGNGLADEGKAVLRVESADRVIIRTGFTEMGQGFFTICVQTACEESGLPPQTFEATTDTSADVDCGQTTASRATVLGALAIMQAARKLRAELNGGKKLADLVGREFRGEYACTYTTKPGADVAEPKTHMSYGFATQVVILDDEGKLKKVIAAHDVGKVMNPTLLEGQLEGSIHMGLGYALTEDFVVEGGRIQSDTIKSVGVLRAHHMPEIELHFIEEPDPETAYGARGVGEIGLVPTAPAVAGALEAFDGIHRTSLPMKDAPAAQAILHPRRNGKPASQ